MLRGTCVKCGETALPYSYLYNRGKKCPKCLAWTCPGCLTTIEMYGNYCRYCLTVVKESHTSS